MTFNYLLCALQMKVAHLLVRRFHVKPKDVVVLTQYRAQVAEVDRQLKEKGENEIDVCTVVASQGKYYISI